MSAALFNQVQHLHAEVRALRETVERLSERVMALEASQPSGQLLDIDQIGEPRRRGRPPKVQP